MVVDCIKVDITGELWACSRHCQICVVRAILLHAAWIPNVNGRTPVVVCIFSNSHQGLTVRACLAPRCSGVLQAHLTYRIMLVLIVKSWPLLAALMVCAHMHTQIHTCTHATPVRIQYFTKANLRPLAESSGILASFA